VVHRGEASLGSDLLGPALHDASLDLDAAPALAAGQVVVVHVAGAPAVERLTAGVPDGVDPAVLAQDLKVPVNGGETDVLAPAAQLGMDLLGAAETGQAVERPGKSLRLASAAYPRAAQRGLRGRRGHHTRTLAVARRCFPAQSLALTHVSQAPSVKMEVWHSD